MPMDNVTLENTQQSISSRDAKSVASVMVNGKWVNLSDTLEQANVKSDVGAVSKQVAEQQKVITSAVAQADSAVAYANDAIEKSRVNSQAIAEINSAVSDAVSDAAVARSDGLRAWDAAQSNVDLIDLNYASASAAISSARTEAIAAADEAKASASAAQADIVAVRSDVAAVQADVTATKSDVAVAKSDIAVAKTNLASQATSLSSYAAQASAAGKDITVLKSQADQFEQDMADTKGDVSQLKLSASSASVALSDAAGNISSLQASAKSYSAALSDTNSNVATVTATASELETKYADAAGDISQIKTDAKGTAETIADAQGDIASLKKRADGFDTQFTNAKSDIAVIQSDATGTKQTLTNAKSDIAVLQSRADGFDTKFADTAGDINTLKVDASGMKQTLTDAQGNISTLQATATGFKNTLTDAQGNISTLQSDVAGLKKTTSDHAGNIATLQADAKTLTSQMSSAQGDISTLKQTASGFSSQVSGMETSLANTNSKLDGMKIGTRNLLHHSDTFDGWEKGNLVTITSDKYLNGTIAVLGNAGIEGGSQICTFLDGPYDNQPVTWTVYAKADNVGDKLHTELWGGGGYIDQPLTNNWQVYQFTGQRNTNNHNLYLWGCQGNKGNIYVALPFAVVGNMIGTWEPNPEDTDAKITTNSTAIAQNKKAITLKADQTVVDKTNGDVQLLQSQLKVQEDQINAKVSSSDLQNLVGKGGRNLLIGSDPTSSNKPSLGGVTEVTVDGVKAWESNNADNIMFHNISLEADTTYTYSALIKADTAGRLGFTSYGHFQVKNPNAHNQADPTHEDIPSKRDYHGINVPANQWTKIYYTFTTNDLANSSFGVFPSHANGHVYIRHLMLEEGMIAHAWQLAPEDVQTYTQTQIKQTSDSWNANLTSVKDGLTDKYTNLHATVDGIKGTVATKADQSEVTQLSNLVQTKVSSGDFTSATTQLKNLINQRVQVGDVISQINQEAGGNTLIQVSNGKGSLILDAGNTIVTGKEWIPVASIADLTADQIQAGTLTGSTVHLGDTNGNAIDLGVLGTDHVGLHSSAKNGDQTYIDYNGIKNSGTGYSTTISQGKITTGYMTVNGGGLIDFRSSGNGTTIDSQNIKFYNSNAVNGGIEFSGGNPLATVRNGTVGNELRVRYDRSFALTPITDESARICASSAAMQVGFVQSGSSTPDLNTTGLLVDNDSRHVNLGVWGADSTWTRVEANTHNIHMQADKAHAWLSSDNVFHIYKDGDSSSNATELKVDGWAWINGWVEAAGHSQHSALSTKTDIQPVDDDKMLEMVNNTDLTTFLYTSDVANGETHRHIGLIIDDVHDVAQYQTPQEFIAPNGVSRDDDNMIGALFGAVKALTKRIKTLESKVG